ncbi:MAG: hypothetical protein AVDCRST_MAG49-4335 [uncultured Thermomicrobiales bacterium]|uniref:HicB-like antitoxin of toxin-antitoxin system domain-containing protein n=1 Tax=uncultured Thermomicrobiales bacterium TaxID=1645740 RepID=A0A6J4VHK3_9BACT|nr:MAG: hypothetical protein AVDCRST_MAG49-4335 [uncultured Thermomicrobiales bacterium]
MTADERGHYSMVIEWEPQDRIFVVTVPELPGCRSHGETYEEALRQGREVIDLWLDAARDWGTPIPPPRYFDLGDDRAHTLSTPGAAPVGVQ